jgi:hypothetical protein
MCTEAYFAMVLNQKKCISVAFIEAAVLVKKKNKISIDDTPYHGNIIYSSYAYEMFLTPFFST